MPKSIDYWRFFIAIELPPSVRHQIKSHIDRLRAEFPTVRASWAREENIHLTLKFLGDTPVEKVQACSKALKHAASKIAPFEMETSGCGAFPPHGQPKVLWIGISSEAQQEAPLHKLYDAIEDECATDGFARETRAFHPHLTIARLRHPQGARRLAHVHKEIGFAPLSVRVQDVCLIRSELSSEGSRYTVISRHEFHCA